MVGWLLLAVVVGFLLYVRFAPSDESRWDVPVTGAADATRAGGATRVVSGGEPALRRIHEAALALPRTELLAGSVDAGRLTYVTRSKAIGFPDYTTVELNDGQIRMFARLRFGKSDFGVNAARLDHLVRAAET